MWVLPGRDHPDEGQFVLADLFDVTPSDGTLPNTLDPAGRNSHTDVG